MTLHDDFISDLNAAVNSAITLASAQGADVVAIIDSSMASFIAKYAPPSPSSEYLVFDAIRKQIKDAVDAGVVTLGIGAIAYPETITIDGVEYSWNWNWE